MDSGRELKGMVLAAGLGTRLRPLTYLRAKPAVPLLGRPIIQYALDRLADAGVRETVINLHYLPETVVRAAARPDMRVHFSHETSILGTAGALARVRDRLGRGTLALINGKIYSEESLARVLDFHRRRKALVTMVVRPWWNGCPYLPVLVDADLRIRGFLRTRPNLQPDRGTDSENGCRPFVFTGIHLLETEVLDRIGEGFSDTVADLYPGLIAEGHPVLAFVSESNWFETSTPERYLQKSIELLHSRGTRDAGIEKQPVMDGVDAFCGPEARLGPGVSLHRCILWDRVELASGVSASNAIFTDDVCVRREHRFRDCIVTPHTEGLAARAEEHGARVLEKCICWPLRFSAGERGEVETP